MLRKCDRSLGTSPCSRVPCPRQRRLGWTASYGLQALAPLTLMFDSNVFTFTTRPRVVPVLAQV